MPEEPGLAERGKLTHERGFRMGGISQSEKWRSSYLLFFYARRAIEREHVVASCISYRTNAKISSVAKFDSRYICPSI